MKGVEGEKERSEERREKIEERDGNGGERDGEEWDRQRELLWEKIERLVGFAGYF